MRILWLTWKDKTHPQAGGAEVISSQLGKRLAADGHEIIFLTGGYPGGKHKSRQDGYQVIRVGGRISTYWQAYRFSKKHLSDWPDLVIEEVNTIPFFSKFYFRKTRRILFFHQLARRIWFYQMMPPFSLVGYLLEPIYLRLLRRDKTVAMSKSTKQDLMRRGFKAKNIHIISEAIELEQLPRLTPAKKFDEPTLLSLGSLRSMKRTIHQIEAFEIAKRNLPNLRLKIAGDASDKYGQKALARIKQSPYQSDIEYLGRVDETDKKQLMKLCHLILVTSVKEGWGLIVTESAAQGTPAVVYDVDGLRDSVRSGVTGLVTSPNPRALATGIVTLLSDKKLYEQTRRSGWQWSKQFTFERCYLDFKTAAGLK